MESSCVLSVLCARVGLALRVRLSRRIGSLPVEKSRARLHQYQAGSITLYPDSILKFQLLNVIFLLAKLNRVAR